MTETAARLAGGGTRPPSWAPLRHPLFRAFWLAGLASNVGAWMQSTAGSWQMTRLTSSTLMVALMQTAANLPALLVGLPAGALADIMDRRRYLIATELWMAGAAALLALLAALGLLTPWTLVALTFVLALGDAADAPAWQAITPDLVPKGSLPSAVLLGGLSVNLARVLGPALAGLLVATGGPATAYALNALSLVGVLVIVVRWRPDPPAAKKSPPERIWSAVRAGVRYVRNAPSVRAIYAQAAVFILFSSALWALLSVVAGSVLHLGASGYGALLASFGVGALLGVGLSPRLRPQLGARRSMVWATALVAVAMLVVAQARAIPLVCLGLAAGGTGWIEVMSCLNLLTLTAVPRWVQARVLGIYWVVVQGGLAAGSLAWGIVASRQGVSAALTWASIGLVAVSLLGRGRRVAPATEDLSPAPDALPKLDRAVEAESGPVLVTVEYRIDPAQREPFTRATRALERIRRRDGAYAWGLYGDLADPARYVETFLVESWAGARASARPFDCSRPTRGGPDPPVPRRCSASGRLPPCIRAARPAPPRRSRFRAPPGWRPRTRSLRLARTGGSIPAVLQEVPPSIVNVSDRPVVRRPTRSTPDIPSPAPPPADNGGWGCLVHLALPRHDKGEGHASSS